MASAIKVTILGKEFFLKSAEGDVYINHVADYVKQKIEAVQKIHTMDIISTVILTCLNIADDYFQSSNARESLIDSIENRSLSLTNIIDSQLEENV